MTVQKIDTYKDFMSEIVEPDFNEFMADEASLPKAWHCATSLFHLHDWVYQAHKVSIDDKYTFVENGKTKNVSCREEFGKSLRQCYPNFEHVRDIANASKHCVLTSSPVRASDTSVFGAAFQRGAFQSDAFQVGKVMLKTASGDIIEVSGLAQSVLDLWKQLFTNEGW